jgi:hypothetical protein
MTRCPYCHGYFEPVDADRDELAKAVEADATVTIGSEDSFREQTVSPPTEGDFVGRGEVGTR